MDRDLLAEFAINENVNITSEGRLIKVVHVSAIQKVGFATAGTNSFLSYILGLEWLYGVL